MDLNEEGRVNGYKNSLEHLQEELRRIELLVHLGILKFRTMGRAAPDEFKNLYITEEEIDAILAGEKTRVAESGTELSRLESLRQQIDFLESKICEQKAQSILEGTLLRLERLKELFQLSQFDVDALLICLAPEIHLKYEKLYAYLQDNVTKKRASVDLVLELLCPNFEDKLSARQRFAPQAPLICQHLLALFSEAPDRNPPLLACLLSVDDRISQYLFGSDQIDARLMSLVRRTDSTVSWQNLILPEGVKDRLENLIRGFLPRLAYDPQSAGKSESLILYFQGPAGAGKEHTAAALCRELEIPLLVVDTARLLHGDVSIETAARLLFREALIQQAALYFDRYDVLLGEDSKVSHCRETLLRELEWMPGLTFLSGQAGSEPAGVCRGKYFVRVDFPILAYPLRKQFWQDSLNGLASANIDLGALTNKFRLTAGQMLDAVGMARSLALWRDPANGSLTSDDLYIACRSQSNQKLSSLAIKISPKRSWSDIVLPKEQMAQIRELLNYVKYRDLVYGAWGFEQKLSLGKGLNVLFSGVSGTGKTMAAEIMARELGLDLYKIDLSMVVSKYIGETEKNLSAIFREGKDSNAILFFDEADALFGKRSEVKDAHDRYANLETAYLLQKMDEHEGIVILATNLRNNMDEAFTRRMQASIEFPFPEEECRRQIFEGIFPKQAPLSSDIDFAFLSRQFKLTGGNIKNIAVHAAFLAAEDDKRIGMAQIIRATKREFEKIGRLCSKADFGPYYDLMKEADV
jgi:SpoVK/Ycf46/Vps4 family AAA+-type ATPase